MARLFIFAIGGTGSRVLKSLVMLLAAGVKPKEDYEIVPIIIDPHTSNEDLRRTDRLLENYQLITDAAGIDNGFFSTRIQRLDKLLNKKHKSAEGFTFNLQEVLGTKFKNYIGYNYLDPPTKMLTELLFSGKTLNRKKEEVDLLELEMDIGFVGNPNIGSIVLDQVKDSDEFKEFASNFNEQDRIFIISSIFGGTGAAGFPAILKNIRGARNNTNIDGKGFLQNARIGALTVLPYFNVAKDDDSPIQKSDFIEKSKSALSYYIDNVNGAVNALYYIGDDYMGAPYKNDPGAGGQKNDAHFIELAAALAIIDFMSINASSLTSESGKAVRPIYKEFATLNDSKEIKFGDFEEFTKRQLSLGLSQMTLFDRCLQDHLKESMDRQPWSKDAPVIDEAFLDDSFYSTYLSEFMTTYREWLTEMAGNHRAFTPFNLKSPIGSLVKDKAGKAGIFKKPFEYHHFDDRLNEISKDHKDKYPSPASKFLKLFYFTTKAILESNYGIKN